MWVCGAEMVCQLLPSPLEMTSDRVEKLLCSRNHSFAMMPSATQQLKHGSINYNNDLTWCYKILFGYVNVSSDEFFAPSPAVHTRGRPYKLLKKQHYPQQTNFFQRTCHQRMEFST